MTTLFPDPAACPDARLVARWEVLLGRSPRLRPWLGHMVGKRRVHLHETGGDVERLLWDEVARWLRDFEALPQFALTAIATTLDDEKRAAPVSAEPVEDTPAPEESVSPERATQQLQQLVADPAFALALHCIEVRVRPRLSPVVPESAWMGLLHASAKPAALLTPDVAVSLVVRVLAEPWMREPAAARRAALRLFSASAGDLRAQVTVQRLCAELPWTLSPLGVTEFVAGAAAARAAMQEACGLCARIVAATRKRSGGLGSLQDTGAPPATPEELAELRETTRQFAHLAGFPRLLALL